MRSFDEWRSQWRNELKVEERIEAIKAMTAFGRAGHGRGKIERGAGPVGRVDGGAQTLARAVEFAAALIGRHVEPGADADHQRDARDPAGPAGRRVLLFAGGVAADAPGAHDLTDIGDVANLNDGAKIQQSFQKAVMVESTKETCRKYENSPWRRRSRLRRVAGWRHISGFIAGAIRTVNDWLACRKPSLAVTRTSRYVPAAS